MMKSLIHRLFLLVLLLSLFQAALYPASHTSAKAALTPTLRAKQQLAELSAEEKVGQLFLITFSGSDIGPESEIYNLIANYHLGGVILKRDNDNFPASSSLPVGCRDLIEDLQWAEFNSSRTESESPFGDEGQSSVYIPLFIGVSQEGNQSNHTEIFQGLSPLPSQLSIGATWNPELAEQVGETVGEELSSLGINLLLGPSLDVLVDPSPGQSDLGVRSFGGDPYWVGKMGQAYVQGVHNGSNNDIAVIGKFFPGLGSADRLPEEEIATVRKSLEQLRQIELAPFFAVTGDAPVDSAAVDGLLNSHIRYQGLQGNIRSTTRPISLDPQAFNLLMGLEPFDKWRSEGGLMISDNLASQALRQLYDPTGISYNIRKVALDAIIAGNDMLLLGNTIDNEPVLSSDIAAALDFFAQKYREDEAFADRVDESVTRILTLKNSIYPVFNITSVTTNQPTIANLERSDIASIVARNSATLINPEIAELDSILPEPPTTNDRLVIISDVVSQRACSECPEISTLGITDLEDAILNLYGPLSGGQLVRANITSYSYKEAITLLDFPSDMNHMENDLFNANWILVAALDLNENRPASQALHRLLSERQDLLREKKIVVFAFNAPFYLDATNISKITAYYGLYNQLPESVEIAARLLFKEIPSPMGRLPVSVPGIGYDLISATSPDPNRSFEIFVSNISGPAESPQPEQPQMTAVPVFEIADVLEFQTGIILDHNGNPVPDGTPVDFVISAQGSETYLPEVTTIDGVASTTYAIDRNVNFEVQAISAPALSNPLQINIIGSESIDPEQTQQNATEIVVTPSITQEPISTPTPSATLNGPDSIGSIWRFWLLSILATAAVAMIAYQVGAAFWSVRWGLRWSFSALIGGLLLYNYLMFGLPGSSWVLAGDSPAFRWGFTSLFGALFGWLISFAIQKVQAIRSSASRSQSD